MSTPRTHAALIVASNTNNHRIECLEYAIENTKNYIDSKGACSEITHTNVENTLYLLREMLDIEITEHEECMVELDLMRAIAAFMAKRKTFESKDLNHYVNEAARLRCEEPDTKNSTHEETILSST